MDYTIIPIGSYGKLATSIADYLDDHEDQVMVLEPKTKVFADGERYHALEHEYLRGSSCVIVGGTIDDAHTLDMYDIACTVQQHRCGEVILVIPFFGYSTMERATKAGEVVKAKTRARLLSSIPASSPVRVLLMDLHVAGVAHYFEGHVQPEELYAKSVLLPMLKRSLPGNFRSTVTLAATDSGRAKWVESLANDLGVRAAFAQKTRIGEEVKITSVVGKVRGRDIILYDDMIRSGKSLVHAANAYMKAGAKSIQAMTTHFKPTPGALDLMSKSPISRIIVTNTVPLPKELTLLEDEEYKYKRLRITEVSVASIFAGAIKDC